MTAHFLGESVGDMYRRAIDLDQENPTNFKSYYWFQDYLMICSRDVKILGGQRLGVQGSG